jgi:hypothetical protein
MTLCKRIVIGVCVVVGMVSAATAQITITKADVQDRLSPGRSIAVKADTLTKSLNIGSPGASSYDFSGLLSHTSTPLNSVNVALTPYVVHFPGATHAVQTNVTLMGIAATVYVYFVLGDNLLNPGTWGGPNPVPGFTVEGSILNSPSDVFYALPSTYGTTWSSKYTETTTIMLNGTPTSTPTAVTHDISYEVDGYGPLKIPGGSTYDALRIKKIDRRSNGTILGYLWLAKNAASVQVTAADTTQPTSGTIAVGAVSWNSGVPTAVESEGSNLPEVFGLEQNYPNPFNPSTVVRYSVPAASRVKLAVYDLLGREVALLVDGETPAGIHSAEFSAAGLPSGVYIARMLAAGFSASRTMVLMK